MFYLLKYIYFIFILKAQKASLETRSSSERSDSSDNSDSETSDTESKSNSLEIIKNNNKKSFKKSKQPAIVYSDGQLSILIKQVIREGKKIDSCFFFFFLIN